MTNAQTDISRFAQLLGRSNNTVFFTGAGISTESGIPDFRSPGTGLWNQIKPIQFQDFVALESAREESWRRKFSNDVMTQAKPNAGHLAIARWLKDFRSGGVITQNVDNLHQESGLDDNQIVELHGNATYASCLSCNTRYELPQLKQQFEETGAVAPCDRCQGLIKTATISFGQSMPEAEMVRAQELVEACDLMIVLGSSLTVYPAAGFPQYAKQLGASLVIVNREPTDQDELADIVIHEAIGQVMTDALNLLSH